MFYLCVADLVALGDHHDVAAPAFVLFVRERHQLLVRLLDARPARQGPVEVVKRTVRTQRSLTVVPIMSCQYTVILVFSTKYVNNTCLLVYEQQQNRVDLDVPYTG